MRHDVFHTNHLFDRKEACLSGCHPQPLAVVFGQWQSSVPTIAPRVPATFSRRRGLRRLPGEGSLERRVCLPPLSSGGRAVPLRKSSWRLTLRKCRRDTGLTVGTVMARSHTPLSVWFWSAYLVSSQTPGVSAVQLRRHLACRATRRRSKSSTSSARGWCARIRTGSAAGPASTSKSMKPGLAAGRAAKAVASTIRFLSPALWRFASASRAPSSTSGRVVAMPGGFGSPSCRTAAREVALRLR